MASALNRAFTFNLSHHEGALLMLPQGGTLTILERIDEFKSRIQRYWRQWYAFADDQRDLDDQQVLYVVTGVERCSMWAMAVWDSMSSYIFDNPGSLELSVDESSGSCRWRFPPARCVARSSGTSLPSDNDALKQSVFVRGFWINRSGDINSTPPPLRSGGHRDRQDPENEGNTDHDEDNGGYKHLRPSGHGSSASNSLCPNQPPATDSGHSESPGATTDSTVSPVGLQIDELDLCISASHLNRVRFQAGHLYFSDSSLLVLQDDNPCQTINKFALALISKAHPALLDAGCIAFSHDEDWMSVMEDVRMHLISGDL
ncbi:hypothetical protein V5O48_018344 [Marasmius crinis-equi]|uniref:Uncharacterized protein n=1 Tax=Marasmius crinis-equi TaxID=585013 RepID=A0ABR3ELF6_9AGAR